MMSDALKVAAIQINAGPRWADHRAQLCELIRAAAAQGARFVATPENSSGIMADKQQVLREAVDEAQHPLVADFAALAQELGIHLLCGSLLVKSAQPGLLANRSLLFSPQGRITARYDKIHLFDVDLPSGERHRESALMAPGAQAVLADVGGLHAGLSICYDVRFAALYRMLAQAGAQLLLVPSAFTVPTGKAHWHTLLRARAIETGSYVMAPAQTGTHDGGRQTYGHAVIIDPWGEMLADAGTEPGFISADLSVSRVQQVRAALPSLQHDRPFVLAPIAGN